MTFPNDDQLKDNIQKNLIFYRKKAKITQKDLSEQLGVAATTVSGWERGATSPDIDTLFAICNLLKVNLYEMCGITVQNSALNEEENALLNTYRSLNTKGQQKLLERAEELRDLGYVVKGDAVKMA